VHDEKAQEQNIRDLYTQQPYKNLCPQKPADILFDCTHDNPAVY
jgi:hypothetical protein